MIARLAPMCGVTDHVFREICSDLGCETGYTEMISAMGFLCAPDQRAVRELMIRGDKEKKLILQLFGRDPDTVAKAAEKIARIGIYDGIDLNMGCPAHKIAPSGEGSGLLRTPDIAYDMMKKTVQSVDIPVSVKIRIGWDSEHINAVDFAQMAEEAGVSEITVHGRTRQQQYSGNADWDIIRCVKDHVHIKVIGNGDLFTAEKAMEKYISSGVDGVMIGRGAMGNPWIFRQICDLSKGLPPIPVAPDEKHAMILYHLSKMCEYKPEKIAIREMRKHIGWYIHGMRGSSKTRNEINHTESIDDIKRILDRFFQNVINEEE